MKDSLSTPIDTTHRRERRVRGRSPLRDVLTLAVLAAFAAIALVIGSAPHAPQNVVTHMRMVQAGDTLWSLAAEHPVEGLSTEQTAELLMHINGLDAPVLVAGTSVAVPSDSGIRAATAMR